MSGLIQQGMQDSEPTPPADESQQPSQPQDAGQPQGNEATPEEQDAYDRVVAAAGEVLYDDKTNPDIMNMLKSKQDNPAQALADVTSMVVIQLDEQSGGKIPEVVILPVVEEILPMVAELANAAGIFKPDDRTMNLAAQQTLMELGEHYGVSEEDIQNLIKQMDPNDVKNIVSQQQSLSASPDQPQPGA
jgi:hypothetical protein